MADLSLSDIENLVREVFAANGCDAANTEALVRTVVTPERDGALSHGLFRVPGYVGSLRSGRVDGTASPVITNDIPAIVHVDGNKGFAPLALERGLPKLADVANTLGVGVMALKRSYHLAALWPETEYLAQQGLVGMAFVSSVPVVAPAGGTKPLLGTNPFSFAWPRPDRSPVVIDMATSAMAQGEVQIAARDGKQVPEGTGLDASGNPTTDPQAILDGVLLPFGGYKGSAISMMIELMAGSAVGEAFSFEAGDVSDGGPAIGGECIIAISPKLLGGDDWAERSDVFFKKFKENEGARLPGERRHQMRASTSDVRSVDDALLAKIQSFV